MSHFHFDEDQISKIKINLPQNLTEIQIGNLAYSLLLDGLTVQTAVPFPLEYINPKC